MAKKILTDVNLNKNEAQNIALQNLASDPSNPVAGQVYFNTTTHKQRTFNGTTWDEAGTGGGSVTSVGISNATNGGLTISGSPVTSSGSITVGHSNTLTSAQTTSGVYPIKIDKNGHISEYGSAVDFSTYAPKASPALTGTPTAPTATAGTNTTQIATTAFVSNAISGVSGGMRFKGTIGTGGTAGTTLPTSNVKVGDTYKIVTAGTYASQSAKIGDLFIATATTPTWAYVPSGDDSSVTSVTAGTGLTTTANSSSDGGTITTTGTLYLTKVLDSGGSANSISFDAYGRVLNGTFHPYPTSGIASITGDGTTTNFDITHALNTTQIIVQVFDQSTNEQVVTDVTIIDNDTIRIGFGTAPTSNDNYNILMVAPYIVITPFE